VPVRVLCDRQGSRARRGSGDCHRRHRDVHRGREQKVQGSAAESLRQGELDKRRRLPERHSKAGLQPRTWAMRGHRRLGMESDGEVATRGSESVFLQRRAE
jgi:hypothetical protein